MGGLSELKLGFPNNYILAGYVSAYKGLYRIFKKKDPDPGKLERIVAGAVIGSVPAPLQKLAEQELNIPANELTKANAGVGFCYAVLYATLGEGVSKIAQMVESKDLDYAGIALAVWGASLMVIDPLRWVYAHKTGRPLQGVAPTDVARNLHWNARKLAHYCKRLVGRSDEKI